MATNGNQRDIVIIGGGHNGLVTAFYLAKAGYKPLVLERSQQVGGAAITDEFHPGFRCSTLSHTAGPIRPDVVRDMQLEKHGLKLIKPEVAVTALAPDGRALSLYQDAGQSSQQIAAFSQKDAAKYSEFAAFARENQQSDRRRARYRTAQHRRPQPRRSSGACSRPDAPFVSSARRICTGCCAGDRWRSPISRRNISRRNCCGRYIAARGVFGTFLGPWSAGSTLVLLIRAAADAHPAGSALFAAGGTGAVTQAMASAAKAAGAEIRTGAEVIEIRVQERRGYRSVAFNGEEINAKAVISNADPKRTLLKLIDPMHLVARLRAEAAALSRQRHGREGESGALWIAEVHGFERDARCAQRPHSHRQRDRLSGARLRRIEVRQFLEAAVSRNRDSHR